MRSSKKEKNRKTLQSEDPTVLTIPVYPSLWGIPIILLILGVLWIFLTDRYTELHDIFVLKFPVWLEEIETLFQQENWLALCGKILIPLMTGILVTLFWLFWMLVLSGLLWIFVFSFLSWWRSPEKWVLRLSRKGILCVKYFKKWEDVLYLGGRKTIFAERVRLECFQSQQGSPVIIWFMHKLKSADCRLIEDFLIREIPEKEIRWESFYVQRPYSWRDWFVERRHTMPDLPYDPFSIKMLRKPTLNEHSELPHGKE